jgi:hypothetical protein
MDRYNMYQSARCRRKEQRSCSDGAYIYTLAHHTVIYLGEGTVGSDAALGALAGETLSGDKFTDIPTDTATFQLAVDHVLSRVWFTRGWVYQELVLSQDPWIQCGRSRMKWDEFCESLESQEKVRTVGMRDPDTVIHVMLAQSRVQKKSHSKTLPF